MVKIKLPGYRLAVATLVNSGFIKVRGNMTLEAPK